jgi:translation initiation factor IF-3
MSVKDALKLAQEKDLDLVEVAPTAKPPVCRIMDYGKYRYEQSKREREARKKQKVIEIKEVRMTPKI